MRWRVGIMHTVLKATVFSYHPWKWVFLKFVLQLSTWKNKTTCIKIERALSNWDCHKEFLELSKCEIEEKRVLITLWDGETWTKRTFLFSLCRRLIALLIGITLCKYSSISILGHPFFDQPKVIFVYLEVNCNITWIV